MRYTFLLQGGEDIVADFPATSRCRLREFANLSFLGVVDLEAACGSGVHCENYITFAGGVITTPAEGAEERDREVS